jgi:hypothetical protein
MTVAPDLRPARGAVIGCSLGAVLWLALALLVWWLWW